MAGWDTQSMIDGLPGVLNLAAAGGTSLATTSDIVTDGLTSMGLTAKDTGKFVDIMAATCSSSNTSIELMGETLKYVGPVAGSLGIEMSDLSLAIGLMGNAGIKGSAAGTALRSGLTNLISPTNTMKKAMDQYGIAIVENADGSVNLTGTMEMLRSKLGGLNESQQAAALSAIFGKEAMSGWASIVNASETDFNNLKASIDGCDGTAKNMADTMMGGASGALTEMKSALEGVAITIGERLTPFIEKFADWVSKLCSKFQELSPETQTFLMVMSAIVAAIGPLLLIGGGLLTLFSNLTIAAGALGISVGALCTPVLIVVGVVAALIAIGVALCQNWDKIKAKASEIGEAISSTWNSICEWTSRTWSSICEAVSGAWDTICNVVQLGIMVIVQILSAAFQVITLPFQLIWQNCKDTVIKIWNQITSFLKGIWNSISSTCSTVFKAIATTLSGIWNSVKNTASSVWNNVKSSLISIWNGIKSTATGTFNGLKSSISGIWNSIKSTTSSVWNNIKESISKPINMAKDAVKGAIDKIKGILNITLPFPKIKLPHFSFSGKFSLNPPSVPKFSVKWYSKGGIFKRPTVLGGIGVGDAHNGIGSNAEAILPINKLPELLGLDNQKSSLNLNIENFNNTREQDIKELVEEIAFYLRRKNIAIGGV